MSVCKHFWEMDAFLQHQSKAPNVEFKGLLLWEALLLTPEATLKKPKAQFENCSMEGQEGEF